MRLAAVAASLVLGLVPACSSSDSPGPPLPIPPQVVDVEMAEYRFVFQPPTRPGRAVMRFHNAGELTHDFVLSELPDDMPPILEQLRGDTRRNATSIAALPPQRPGNRTALALDLPPGRYALLCFVPDPDGQQHVRKGMASEFRIKPA